MVRNAIILSDILHSKLPSLVFLGEPQAYQCDMHTISQILGQDYCCSLNSDDVYDLELPLYKSKAKGGTMILWQKWLDPFIKTIPVTTSAFLPIVLTLPASPPTVHVAIYLPTHGQDTEFVSELASLRNCLDNLNTIYDFPSIYIRGDSNVNAKNTHRVSILKSFLDDYKLVKIEISHKTYHHFVGNGEFDSNVDVLLQPAAVDASLSESVSEILCKHDVPAINSHHDAIMSKFGIPAQEEVIPTSNLLTAPKLKHMRTTVFWTEQGIVDYARIVQSHLKRIRETWLIPTCQASMSILLQLTNHIMTEAAIATNKFKFLGKPISRKRKIPDPIKKARNHLNKAHKKFKCFPGPESEAKFKKCRKTYHQTVRTYSLQSDMSRDSHLFNIMGANPASVFKFIKSVKTKENSAIARLTVGNKTYKDEKVADGFYDSMSTLKQVDYDELRADPALSEKFLDYDIVLELCKTNQSLPTISIDKSSKILKKIKKNVKDHFSITALHYINAGDEGLLHFCELLNGVISDLNNAGLDELNIAHGLIYYKRHKKDKTSDRSYRTISSCPFLSKALDLYVRDLCSDLWQQQQAATQYQGVGSSHELASLLVTEVIQYSMFVSNKPVYLLALDAQSAFDRCLRQVLVSELFKAKMPPPAILLIDKRLANRSTVYEWEGQVMGPANDVTGFEQGGVNSSDYYKIYNNEQLNTAQESLLGVNIGSQVVAAVGQADDVILAASSPYDLQLLVTLTEQYCSKFRVKLEPSKTKLLVYANKSHSFVVEHALNCQAIKINGIPVKRTTEADHVGVLRSDTGNLPHIVNRIATHKSALHALMPAGIARKHRGNPAASLMLSKLYGTPVLLSGVASLVLSQAEINILDGHYLKTLQMLLRLHDKTPRSIVYYLAGSLPAAAYIHQRQMSLFAMVCHLREDPLFHHALHVLLHSKANKKSWFVQVKNICMMYGLPHPLKLLEDPPAKAKLNKLVKLRVTEYWHNILSQEVLTRSSLRHFTPTMHSLTTPHPLWKATGSNSFEVNRSTILARMISGRYRTEALTRFWTDNRQGFCLAPTCNGVVGDLEHLLLHCPALHTARQNLLQMWLTKAAVIPALHCYVVKLLSSPPSLIMSFILDPTSLPPIITMYQNIGTMVLDIIFYMTRTFAYGLHRKKLITIGKWPYSTKNENCCPNNNDVVAGVSLTEPDATDDPHDVSDDPSGDASGADQGGLHVQIPPDYNCRLVYPSCRPTSGWLYQLVGQSTPHFQSNEFVEPGVSPDVQPNLPAGQHDQAQHMCGGRCSGAGVPVGGGAGYIAEDRFICPTGSNRNFAFTSDNAG